jgi:hypothetical protein
LAIYGSFAFTRKRPQSLYSCGFQGVFAEDEKERVEGIEPSWPAWKAGTLPLSYTRITDRIIAGRTGGVNGISASGLWKSL